MQLKFFILIFVSFAVIFAGALPKLPDSKKEEIAKDFIAQITYSFGTKTNDQVEAAVREHINNLDNLKTIEVQGANRPVKLDTALQTVTTNAYNAGKEFWAEVWGHYLSRRIYQEILAINNANQKKNNRTYSTTSKTSSRTSRIKQESTSHPFQYFLEFVVNSMKADNLYFL
ncbi:unnamed protein product [Rhizophagus irregularis]|uniref:Uncharacterized protein n=1 Tax=Rhizophagus irregularis TaxID=588596 RepID=A0A2N1MM17_9GLOM|nr:hypothetical protein RhiirC2_790058 [Rhizophagus irregularis]CAB4381967.1 unnamed protein product [Rhizophagus irregularis]CAB5352657.1 unnamed protein product [Rhizophagus irregularis]